MQQERMDFSNQTIVILGLARQGTALARFFVRQGARVVLSDAAPATKLQHELEKLEDLPVELVLGGHPLSLLDDCNLLCLSGGVPPQLEFVQTAIQRGIALSNDTLLTLQLARQRGLGPIVAITGSSGKTTTTTLTGLMLAESGKRVYVGGNIGTPLLDRLDEIEPGACLVLELSSFQLELFNPALAWGSLTGIGPDVAAILNITPNHLDRHPNMAAYAAAKFNLLRDLPPHAQVVLNLDDAVTRQVAGCNGKEVRGVEQETSLASWNLAEPIATAKSSIAAQQSSIIPFSRQQQLTGQAAWLEDTMLVYNGQPFCQREEVRLRGDHNISNLLAAAAISGAAGANGAAMGRIARTFCGVPHRLEVVSNSQGVTWINDSIATSPERAVAALRSFEPGYQKLILLAGGKDKNLPWDLFADEVIRRVSSLIGFGHAGAMIIESVQERARFTQKYAPNCAVVQRLDEAVELAARVAYADQTQPTVILLSPGGTSYDAYKDFEARGEHFRQLVIKWTRP